MTVVDHAYPMASVHRSGPRLTVAGVVTGVAVRWWMPEPLGRRAAMEIEALAALAGDTLVTVAVTDAFDGLRHKIARLFGRGNPDEATQRRLDVMRQRLATAEPGQLDRQRAVQAGQWETRFVDLLADCPEAGSELAALVAEMKQAIGTAGSGNVTNTISGTVHGPVVMGRDFGDISIGSPPGPTSDE